MNMISQTRTCLACSKVLRGRVDKKYCNDSCRNNFNNHQKSETTNLARNIIHVLRKNKKILEELLGSDDMVKTTKERLLSLDFLFKYHTHTYITQRGDTYYYCFEFGYLALDHDWYLVVKRNE